LIYVASAKDAGLGPIYLYRLKSDGTPDSQFGNNGMLIDSVAAISTDYEGLTAMMVQPDKKILLVGTLYTAAIKRTDIWVIRYNEDGSRDNSFGVNGLSKFNPYQEYYSSGTNNRDAQGINRIVLLSGGRILLGGKFKSYTQQKEDFLIVRLNAKGTLDPSFGQQGVVLIGMQDIEQVSGMALQKDSNIVIGGPCGNGYTAMRMFRLKPNGTPDPTFGTKVTSTGNIGYNLIDLEKYANQAISDLVVLPDDRIMIGGNGSNNRLVVFRFSKNGVVDSSYGKNGLIDSSFKQQGQGCNRVALDNSSGRLYVAGSVAGNGSSFCYVAAVKIGEGQTGIEGSAMNGNTFRIYPNPAAGEVRFEGISNDQAVEVRILTVCGKELHKMQAQQNVIDISEIPSGIYLIRVGSAGAMYSARLIIQH